MFAVFPPHPRTRIQRVERRGLLLEWRPGRVRGQLCSGGFRYASSTRTQNYHGPETLSFGVVQDLGVGQGLQRRLPLPRLRQDHGPDRQSPCRRYAGDGKEVIDIPLGNAAGQCFANWKHEHKTIDIRQSERITTVLALAVLVLSMDAFRCPTPEWERP